MYLAEYEDPQLNGFFSKIFKKVGRAVKKVAKPALHIGAAVVTGGSSLALSANMLAQARARKEAQAQADQIAKAMRASVAPVPMVAKPAAPVTRVTSIAPQAAKVSRAQPLYQSPPPSRSIASEYTPRRASRASVSAGGPGGLPSWAVPAGIGAVALVGVLAVAGRSKS